MSDFTQGPFSVAETRHKYDIVIRGPKNEPIALVLIAGFSKKEGAANASLLAAAPDLLRLLKEARRTLEMWKDVAPAVSLCADIDAAIAKATGDQP